MTEFLSGEKCYLRALRREDLDGPWADWLNDPEVTKYMIHGAFPTTREANASFYDEMSRSTTDLVLAIMGRLGHPHDKHIGNVGLHRIDPIHRTAEFGILLGDRGWWGQGIGTEATRLLCRHGFDRLNLAKIWLGVLEAHEAARRCYEKVGFRFEGHQVEQVARDRRRADVLLLGLLPHELK